MRLISIVKVLQFFFILVVPLFENLIIGVKPIEDEASKVPPNTPYYFTAFGRNLPLEGYQFTAADNCEGIAVQKDRTTVDLTVKSATDEFVGFPSPARWIVLYTDGIPFSERDYQFQLCNNGTVNTSKSLLSITSNYEPIGYWRIAVCLCLLLLSALFSALLLAYITYSINEITDMSREGSGVPEKDRVYASKILPCRITGNYLICTFAAANTIVNVLFTILLTAMFVNSQYKVVLSYTMPSLLLLIFGEVLPQSFALQYSLPIAANFRFVTKLAMVLMWPIAKPLSMFTDCLLGKEAYSIYTAGELENLWKLKAKKMNGEQREIINRIFALPSKTVKGIMTKIEVVFLLNFEDTLDDKMLLTIMERGYTRIPVFSGRNRDNVEFVINIKDVAGLPDRNFGKVSEIIQKLGVENSQMSFVHHNMQAMDLMQEMRNGDRHICAVIEFVQGHYKVIGIVTFEDILEQLFGNILDDADHASNNRRSGMHKDQKTLDWFRAAVEWKKPSKAAPLPVMQHLHIIHHTLECVPELATLGFELFQMKELLSMDKMRTSLEGELLSIDLIIIYEGRISYGDHPSFTDCQIAKTDRPFVLGAHYVRGVFEMVASTFVRFDELPTDTIRAVKAVTKCFYFSIDPSDILKTLEQFEDTTTRKEFIDGGPFYRTLPPFNCVDKSQEVPKEPVPVLKKRLKDLRRKEIGNEEERAALILKKKKPTVENRQKRIPQPDSEKSQDQPSDNTMPSFSNTQSSRHYP